MASASAEFTALRILNVLRGGDGNGVSGSQSIERTLEQILDALAAGTVIITGGGGGGGGGLVALSDATPTAVQPGVAAVPGAGTEASRDTHVHNLDGVTSAAGGSADATVPLVKDRRVTIGGAVIPGSLPTRQVNAVRWGRLSNVVFIGINAPATVNSVVAYPYSGTAFGTPANGAAGNININGVDVAPDSDAFVLAACGTAPFVQALPWSGSAFSAAITPSPGVTGAGAANKVRFHPDGDYFALCRQHSGGTTPGLSVFAFNGVAIGAATHEISDSRNANDCSWSPDGNYLAVGFDQTPFFEVYPFDHDTGLFGTPIVPVAAPAVGCEAIDWSDDGDFIAVGVVDANRLWVFPWDSVTATLGTAVKATGTSIPTANLAALKFSPDRAFISTAFGGSPFTQLHSFAFDGSFIGIPASIPTSGAPAVGQDTDISPDGAFVATGLDGTTRLVASPLTRSIGA